MNQWNNGYRPRQFPNQQYHPRLTERMQGSPPVVTMQSQGTYPTSQQQQAYPQHQVYPPQQAYPTYTYPAPTIANAPVSPPTPATPSPANPYCATPEQREELHILAAILNGTGVPNPRKLGVGALVTAGVAIGINVAFILIFERYYVWAAVIPAPLLLCGAFMAITNQPRVSHGVRPPQWVRFVLAILTIIGLFGSFTLIRFLSGR